MKYTKGRYQKYLSEEYGKLSREQLLTKFFYLAETRDGENSIIKAWREKRLGTFLYIHDREAFDKWYAAWVKEQLAKHVQRPGL